MCAEFSPPLYLPAPEFPLIDGETVSAQIQSEMNLGFIKRKASYKEEKKKEKKVPQTWRDKLSYNGFSPVSLQSLSCIRAWRLWWLGVILQCVGRVWMCPGYQGRHPFVKCSRWQRLEKSWLRWRFEVGNKVWNEHKTDKYRKCKQVRCFTKPNVSVKVKTGCQILVWTCSFSLLQRTHQVYRPAYVPPFSSLIWKQDSYKH